MDTAIAVGVAYGGVLSSIEELEKTGCVFELYEVIFGPRGDHTPHQAAHALLWCERPRQLDAIMAEMDGAAREILRESQVMGRSGTVMWAYFALRSAIARSVDRYIAGKSGCPSLKNVPVPDPWIDDQVRAILNARMDKVRKERREEKC